MAKCNLIREKFYSAGNPAVRWSAGRHLGRCPDCRQWLTEQRAAEKLLASLPSHPLPENLRKSLRSAIPAAREKMSGGAGASRRRNWRPALAKSLALAGFLAAALLLWLTAGKKSSLAWAEMAEALGKVQTVHITGFTSDNLDDNGKEAILGTRKEKWLRKEPFAFREETSLPSAKTPGYTLVGEAENTYWYFPSKSRVSITKPMRINFIEELTTLQGWEKFRAEGGPLPKESRGELGGRPVTIVFLPSAGGGQSGMRLYISPASKLVLRAEAFDISPIGLSRKVMEFDFEYNPPLPAGLFEFTPPAGTEIIDKLHSP